MSKYCSRLVNCVYCSARCCCLRVLGCEIARLRQECLKHADETFEVDAVIWRLLPASPHLGIDLVMASKAHMHHNPLGPVKEIQLCCN